MKTKPAGIPPGRDFYEEWRTTGEREKQKAHAVHPAEPAHSLLTDAWGKPARLEPELVGSHY